MDIIDAMVFYDQTRHIRLTFVILIVLSIYAQSVGELAQGSGNRR